MKKFFLVFLFLFLVVFGLRAIKPTSNSVFAWCAEDGTSDTGSHSGSCGEGQQPPSGSGGTGGDVGAGGTGTGGTGGSSCPQGSWQYCTVNGQPGCQLCFDGVSWGVCATQDYPANCSAGSTPAPTSPPPPPCDPNAWGSWTACLPSPGTGTQTRTNACGTTESRNCCTSSAPSTPTLSSPTNTTTLGNTNVTFSWNEITNWGYGTSDGLTCANTNQYLVYADTSSSPTTLVCTVSSGTTTCATTLTDQTNYYWKVRATNGSLYSDSAVWSFSLKQPKICGTTSSSTLFEDVNQNGCYNTSSEFPVSIGTINVYANGQLCAKPTATTFCCTIPGGVGTVVNLSTNSFNPPYTGQTNCSTGTDASCLVNNCSVTVNPGDNVAVNIGFSVKPWYQTNSGTVGSGGDIISIIPATPLDYDTGSATLRYLVLNQAGVVGAGQTLNFGSSGGQASSNNYQTSSYSPSLTQFKYSFFKQKLLNRSTKIGSGGIVTLSSGKLTDGGSQYPVTNNSVWDITGSLDLVDSSGLSGINSVILSSGNITVSGNFTPSNSSLALVTGGNISVNPTVTQINGLYLSDGTFTSGTTTNQGLKVTGQVLAHGGVLLNRNWENTYKPAEYFVFDPSLYINLAPLLGTPAMNWQEVAP